MFSMMPAEVLVNLRAGAFSIRGRGETSVYADDIVEKQYEQMLKEWSRTLTGHDRGKLTEALRAAALRQDRVQGKQFLHFKLDTNLGPLKVDAHLCDDPQEKLLAIRMERID